MTELLEGLSQYWKAGLKVLHSGISIVLINSLLNSTVILILSVTGETSAQSVPGFVGKTEQFVVNNGAKSMVGYIYRKGQKGSQNIEVYIDRPRTKGGLLVAKFAANRKRADLKDLLRLTDDRVGFYWSVPKALAFSGRKIFVYPENQNQVLPSEIAENDQSILLSPYKSPYGLSYGIESNGSEQSLTGWVYDENSSQVSMKVQVYVDAPREQAGKFVMEVPVTEVRSKIAKLNGFKRSDIGFRALLPGWVRDSGRKVYLSCILENRNVIDIKFQKGGRSTVYDIAFQSSELTNSAVPSRVLSWSPGIRSPRRVRALSQDPWIQLDTMTDESGGANGTDLFWLVSTSMEDQNYSPVRPEKAMNAISPEDPLYRVSASQLDNGNYSFRMVMDKMTGKDISGANVIPAFLFGAINESFDIAFDEIQKPRVGDNLYVDITYRVNQLRAINSPGIHPAKARISVGLATRYHGSNHGVETSEKKYVEINLERTQSYDLCPKNGKAYSGIRLPLDVSTLNSDPEGIYDSRHVWGISAHKSDASAIRNSTSGGELVYYDRRAIGNWIVKTEMGDGWIRLRLPISFLMVRYDWQRLPNHWNAVQVGGIYLGLEIWGLGFLDWEIKDVNVFSMKNGVN